MDYMIEHNSAERRFQTLIDGHLCVVDYQASPGVMHITHTGVHPSLEGRGIAATLVAAAFAHAKVQSLKVDPLCSYVRAYVRRHPELRPWIVSH